MQSDSKNCQPLTYEGKAEPVACAAWTSVPKEPTELMLIAGCEANPTEWNKGTPDTFPTSVAKSIWDAMLYHAPRLPAQPAPAVEREAIEALRGEMFAEWDAGARVFATDKIAPEDRAVAQGMQKAFDAILALLPQKSTIP
ncbi:MAG: hypothetical protein J0H17_00065, partial [Rhizobiales bacterium]|nr:hypothetical protein [Hyphomicrobiales bacterium]